MERPLFLRYRTHIPLVLHQVHSGKVVGGILLSEETAHHGRRRKRTWRVDKSPACTRDGWKLCPALHRDELQGGLSAAACVQSLHLHPLCKEGLTVSSSSILFFFFLSKLSNVTLQRRNFNKL